MYAFDFELRRAPQVASTPLLAEIRLTWWSEALGEIYRGFAVRRHPVTLALTDSVARRDLPRALLEEAVDARLHGLGEEEAGGGDVAAAEAITEAAARLLDPSSDVGAARVLGRAWGAGLLTGEARAAAGRISPRAFPAVAHATLAGRGGGPLARRLRVTWAVARGRV